LIKKIARREGFGNVLAEGSRRAAEIIGKGAAAYAMHAKGLELSGYEPRGAKCTGYNYATSNIGGSHAYGYASQETFGMNVPRAANRFAEAENADIVIYNQNTKAITECGIICSFATSWGEWTEKLFYPLLVAASGMAQLGDAEHMKRVGERIVNLERAFNVREGFGRKDDTLPQRMLTEPLHNGGLPGEGEMFREMDGFLDNYYSLRGWTGNGAPTADKLRELGLSEIAGDMSRSRT
jgi:aldehyde:ferredoxin oxidoreductase